MQFAPTALLGPLPLGILLALVLVLVGGLSAAFVYHWRRFGMQTRLIERAPALYFSGTAFLAAFAIISYLATV